jgi:hypothetical protein
VLEQRLERAQDGGEAAGGAGGAGDQRIAVAVDPALGDLDGGRKDQATGSARLCCCARAT